MNIIEIIDNEDGTRTSILADETGAVVGRIVFTDESEPQPEVGPWPRPGFWSRIWDGIFG